MSFEQRVLGCFINPMLGSKCQITTILGRYWITGKKRSSRVWRDKGQYPIVQIRWRHLRLALDPVHCLMRQEPSKMIPLTVKVSDAKKTASGDGKWWFMTQPLIFQCFTNDIRFRHWTIKKFAFAPLKMLSRIRQVVLWQLRVIIRAA